MTGRPDYDAGDLVVCVRTERLDSPDLGRVFCVLAVVSPDANDPTWGAVVGGRMSQHWSGSFLADSFRKVDPLPDALTSLLASKPVRERIDA